eukprot:Selendium_serpulae@DN5669_c0_g1_i2.p1
MQQSPVSAGATVILFTCCWYISSSKNAVATQLLFHDRLSSNSASESLHSKGGPIATATILTTLQLFCGLCLSKPLTCVLRAKADSAPNAPSGESTSKVYIFCAGMLHFSGCLLTNFAFAYGSASLVQVVKLLEPIETFILATFVGALLHGLSSAAAPGLNKVVAIFFIVAGTYQLLAQSSKITVESLSHPAIAFTLISGLLMSSHNVLYKTTHRAVQSTKSTECDVKRRGSADDDDSTLLSCQPPSSAGLKPITSPSSSTPRSIWRDAARKGLENFGVMTGAACVPGAAALVAVLLASQSDWKDVALILKIGKAAIAFHGMFHIFSITVLSMLAAESHSLLNVGKRIFNVLVAFLYFGDPVGLRGTIGLALAGIGGLVYALPPQIPAWCIAMTRHPDSWTLRSKQCLGLAVVVTWFATVNLRDSFRSNKHRELLSTATFLSKMDQPLVVTNDTGCQVAFRDGRYRLCNFPAYETNFGDIMGPAIVKRIIAHHFQCDADHIPVETVWNRTSGRRQYRCLVILGSIMHMVQPGDDVWTTGINPSRQGDNVERLVRYHTVRGPKTRKFLTDRGATVNSTHVGDSGTIIKLFFPEISERISDGIPCVVPHFNDHVYVSKQLELLVAEKKIRILNVLDPWKDVVAAISRCRTVASSSLHGLVVADAIGVPNMWFQFPTGEVIKWEGHFKYLDYFLSVGRSTQEPEQTIDSVFKFEKYDDPPSAETIDKVSRGLLASFPYWLFSSRH